MSELETLREIIERESPSADKAACDALAQYLRDRLAAVGAQVQLHPNDAAGEHVEARFGESDRRPALILCHYDTVWPRGTTAKRPFRVEDGRAYGPGIFDMKTSLVLVEMVLRRLRERPTPRPITILMTSDEEIGSRSSRALIEQRAREAAYVLVLEPPLAPGVIKMRRKGTGGFRVEIIGRAAHAGLEPEKGISALVELAHQILRVSALTDLTKGTTVTVGLARGGTAANVVPGSAEAQIDVRIWTQPEAERVSQAILSSESVLAGTQIRVTGGLNRPPMELSPQQEQLFESARVIAASRGFDLKHGSAGGGSDGNFTTALGVPTLDGLGCPGDGAHAEHEHIIVDRLVPQAELLEALVRGL
jgi:glutamate carboxypeptidase